MDAKKIAEIRACILDAFLSLRNAENQLKLNGEVNCMEELKESLRKVGRLGLSDFEQELLTETKSILNENAK